MTDDKKRLEHKKQIMEEAWKLCPKTMGYLEEFSRNATKLRGVDHNRDLEDLRAMIETRKESFQAHIKKFDKLLERIERVLKRERKRK